MKFIVRTLTEDDLQNVDDLGRKYRNTIGFLTRETYCEYLRKESVIGAFDSNNTLVGFLLFASYRDRIRIAQLCVDESFRGQGIARLLFEELKHRADSQTVIKLRCRRDFPANAMWPKLGFVPMDESPGRSAQGLPLTLWCYKLKSDDELGLWRTEASDDILDVAIDAQIFYDFNEPDSTKSLISKGLQNDFLIDSLKFWITDELFLEIHRSDCALRREESRSRAHGMAVLEHDEKKASYFTQKLKQLLPYEKENQRSDVRHIAKVAASNIKTFVTKDEELLIEATRIADLTGVTVIHPAQLITSIHEIAETQSYAPSRVSGLSLRWSRVQSGETEGLPVQNLHKKGESKGNFLENLHYYLSYPYRYSCEILKSNDEIVALRVIERHCTNELTVCFARIHESTNLEIFGGFIVADTISLSISESRKLVTFKSENIPPSLSPILLNMGFNYHDGEYIRFTFPDVLKRDQSINLISELRPQFTPKIETASDRELEKYCSPIVLQTELPNYLVPIKPAFAMGLIDRVQAEDDLFGSNHSVLLRWENVYYRSNTFYKMLKAPGRILWYVSGSEKAVIGISHLDEVTIGKPKDLFRQYKRFGILEWRDIYRICNKDISCEIMAMKFSETFMFRNRVTLDTLRSIYSEFGIAVALQSPSLIPFGVLEKFYETGYN